jgi:hypothetical protein
VTLPTGSSDHVSVIALLPFEVRVVDRGAADMLANIAALDE